jgi:putative oxidoreductase
MINRILGFRSLNTDLASLLLRMIIGGLFMYYGYMKVESYDQFLPMFTDIIGIGAKLSFNLVIFAELGCGFLVLIGFMTRLTIIPIFITMAVAYFIAHKNDPFLIKQIAFLYLMLCPVVFILGPGRYSVDGWLETKSINKGKF